MKELLATRMNLMHTVAPDDNTLETAIELICICSEPESEYAGAQLMHVRKPSTLRFAMTIEKAEDFIAVVQDYIEIARKERERLTLANRLALARAARRCDC